jgi:cob(I)alamin adenosyltransferase
MKIYTKTGDSGKTSLYDGNRVDKDDVRVEAYGTIDELNAFLGDSVNYLKEEDKKILRSIQKTLFDVGGELATKEEGKFKNTIKEEDIKNLEDIIDKYMEKTGDMQAFTLPGTSKASSKLHIARTVCRRAERRIISLDKIETVNPMLLKYINRLSDLLYAVSRKYEEELIFIEF